MTHKVWTYEEKPSVHWMCLQMSELTLYQIEMGRMWVRWDDDEYNWPVAKNYLYQLLIMAEKYLKMRDCCDQ